MQIINLFAKFALSNPLAFATIDKYFRPLQNRIKLESNRIDHPADRRPVALEVVQLQDCRSIFNEPAEDKNGVFVNYSLMAVASFGKRRTGAPLATLVDFRGLLWLAQERVVATNRDHPFRSGRYCESVAT